MKDDKESRENGTASPTIQWKIERVLVKERPEIAVGWVACHGFSVREAFELFSRRVLKR